jgi:tetratricopeptide (TPR) repeat protein
VLFAVHPIQVESVAWIAGFSTPLFSLFCLLAALQYLKHSGSEEGNWAAYGLALLAFVAGCLSKSAAVVLAPTLVLLDLWRPAALPLRTRLVGYLPFFALALGFGLLTIYSREASNMAVGNASNGFTVLDRLLLVTFTPVFYWYKLLAPLSLNIYYSFDKMSGALPTYYFAAPVVVAAAGLLARRFRHSAPWLGWGLLFFFVNISVTLPFASLSTFELRADHYNYLACIGIFYLLVEGWMALQQRFPTQAGLIKNLGRAWVVLLVVLCLMQVRVWKDTVSVLTNAIDNGYYQRGMMYFARGVEYGDLGKPQAAMADFNSALAIDPEMRDAYKFRGSLHANAGQIDFAVQDFEKYLSYDPVDAVTWNNMGEIYFRRNQLDKALAAFTKAIEIKPDAAISYQKRSKIYELMGNLARAEADLNKAKELAQIRRDNKAGK